MVMLYDEVRDVMLLWQDGWMFGVVIDWGTLQATSHPYDILQKDWVQLRYAA